MTSPGAAFSLRYELQPDDFRELFDGYSARRRRRITHWFVLVGSVLVFSALVAVALANAFPSGPDGSAGLPAWLVVAQLTAFSFAVTSATRVWLLSPRRFNQRIWEARSEMHGIHTDEIGADGVTWIAPDGRRVFVPWSAVAGVRETDHAFCLTSAKGDTVSTLPKRGLLSPGLVPELRAFLHDSVGKDPAAGPVPAAGTGNGPDGGS